MMAKLLNDKISWNHFKILTSTKANPQLCQIQLIEKVDCENNMCLNSSYIGLREYPSCAVWCKCKIILV